MCRCSEDIVRRRFAPDVCARRRGQVERRDGNVFGSVAHCCEGKDKRREVGSDEGQHDGATVGDYL